MTQTFYPDLLPRTPKIEDTIGEPGSEDREELIDILTKIRDQYFEIIKNKKCQRKLSR